MNELKPCPFCGGEATMQSGQYAHYVGCENCDAWTHISGTSEKAAAAWNRRDDGWARVEDGLPEPNTMVYVWVNGAPSYGWRQVEKNDAWWNTYNYIGSGAKDTSGVTHWRPLPPPPDEAT